MSFDLGTIYPSITDSDYISHLERVICDIDFSKETFVSANQYFCTVGERLKAISEAPRNDPEDKKVVSGLLEPFLLACASCRVLCLPRAEQTISNPPVEKSRSISTLRFWESFNESLALGRGEFIDCGSPSPGYATRAVSNLAREWGEGRVKERLKRGALRLTGCSTYPKSLRQIDYSDYHQGKGRHKSGPAFTISEHYTVRSCLIKLVKTERKLLETGKATDASWKAKSADSMASQAKTTASSSTAAGDGYDGYNGYEEGAEEEEVADDGEAVPLLR